MSLSHTSSSPYYQLLHPVRLLSDLYLDTCLSEAFTCVEVHWHGFTYEKPEAVPMGHLYPQIERLIASPANHEVTHALDLIEDHLGVAVDELVQSQ